MPSRAALWLHALLAVVGLWTFYTLLFWACLSALPQSEGVEGRVAGGAAALGLGTLIATGVTVPWLLDRLLRVQWIRVDEAGDVGPHLRNVLETWHLPLPYLGVVVDADPCALTYGLTRRSARLVLSSGLLGSLDVDQQCAIATHEAGHLASGDFRFATLFAGPMLIMTQLRALFEGSPERFGAAAAAATPFTSGGFLTPLLGVLLRIHTFFYAGFAQEREQWADRFASDNDSAKAHPAALLEILDRLAGPGDARRHAFAVAARGFTPIDAATAGRLGTAAAWEGELTRERLVDLARVVEANPASELAQQTALHPPTGERIPGGGGHPARLSPFSLARLFSIWLPALGFVIGFAISLVHGGWFGLPFILWGCGRIVWLALAFGRTHGEVANEAALHDVMEKFAAEPARAFRTSVAGKIVGRGVPDQSWCPDYVLEAGGVYLAVRPRPVLGPQRQGVERNVLERMEGKECVARGVLRMLDVPYLELHSLELGNQRVWSSWFIPLHLAGSVLLIALGLLLLAPQWMGM
jgi:Zn-dependent protease with chaperone function